MIGLDLDFARVFLLKYKLALWFILGVALLSGGYGMGRLHEARKSRPANQTVKIVYRQAAVVTKTETVYRDRVQKIYLKGETIEHYIPTLVQPVDERLFAVNAGFVRILDAAWAGEAPGPARDSDREPAGIPLGQLAHVQVDNATVCHAWRDQALGWRQFYADQQIAINGQAGAWANKALVSPPLLE